MKKTIFRLLLALFLCGVVSVGLVVGQGQNPALKNKVLTKILLVHIARMHYNPLNIDDKLSVKAFQLFIKRLDYHKRFLLAADVAKLKVNERLIDDQLNTGTWTCFEQGYTLLDQRIREAQGLAQEILVQPFDFTAAEWLDLDPEKRDYCQSPTELKERWRKLLKYQTMLRYIDLTGGPTIDPEALGAPAAENAPPKKPGHKKLEDFKKIDPKLEADARAKVGKTVQLMFKRLLEQKAEDRVSLFLNAVTNCFDPHTSYFPPEQKEDFDIDMTGTLEGIGAILQEEDGYIKVMEIVPGSASWRQKELKPGDIILKVAQGPAEPEDIVDMPLRQAVRLIRGKKGTEVRLTVKKPSGQLAVVPIVRDIVVIDETYARSALITDTRHPGTVYGYCHLPKFYHDFKKSGSRNSADDIRTELQKLKREGVRGLVLDLRSNGGGSLDDAVNMAGLFFDMGPVVQVRGRGRASDILTDEDPTTVFDAPLVVLVDANSASASEIVAAALQDYGRAVIVGAPSTFGKGTVQTLMDLDSGLRPELGGLGPMGTLKLTIQKFYRINGGATQYKGVVPDIVLPDVYGDEAMGEKTLDNSLPWDTVASLSYQLWDRAAGIDRAALRQRSSARVDSSTVFRVVRQNIVRLQKLKQENRQTLNLQAAWQEQQRAGAEADSLEALEKRAVALSAQVLAVDAADMQDIPDKQEKIKDWLDQLKQDAYIEEALRVLEDMK